MHEVQCSPVVWLPCWVVTSVKFTLRLYTADHSPGSTSLPQQWLSLYMFVKGGHQGPTEAYQTQFSIIYFIIQPNKMALSASNNMNQLQSGFAERRSPLDYGHISNKRMTSYKLDVIWATIIYVQQEYVLEENGETQSRCSTAHDNHQQKFWIIATFISRNAGIRKIQ